MLFFNNSVHFAFNNFLKVLICLLYSNSVQKENKTLKTNSVETNHSTLGARRRTTDFNKK